MTNATVLLVEDNEDIASASCALLETYGFTVHVAKTARDALAKLTELETVDILFSDIRLGPDEDGIWLAREVISRYPNVHVVLTTGYSSAYKEPITATWTLVPKPYICRQVVEVFERLLKAPK